MNNQVPELKPKILKVLKCHGIKKAGIFGSYARGEQKRTSDVDILVQTPEEMSLFGFVGVKRELEEILHKKVDLVEYDTIRPALRERILKEEVKIL